MWELEIEILRTKQRCHSHYMSASLKFSCGSVVLIIQHADITLKRSLKMQILEFTFQRFSFQTQDSEI